MIEHFNLVRFYFFPGKTLLNYTTCIEVCEKRGMHLPNVNDFEKIREFTANQTVFRQQSNRTESEGFLTYFIGIWDHYRPSI